MKQKINDILYDTDISTLMVSTKANTRNGTVSISLFRTPNGYWFQTIGPSSGFTGQLLETSENQLLKIAKQWLEKNREDSESLGSEKAKRWLEKHGFIKQVNNYFKYDDHPSPLDDKSLVAEWEDPFFPSVLGGKYAEKLYYDPDNGWILNKTKESALIPLDNGEIEELQKVPA
ncbi:MAG: hypothetical protein GY699_19610 [Desulfobacteraceae bacterium]|nr:hypothetical protein [Desulfobacteraceae bacterium]